MNCGYAKNKNQQAWIRAATCQIIRDGQKYFYKNGFTVDLVKKGTNKLKNQFGSLTLWQIFGHSLVCSSTVGLRTKQTNFMPLDDNRVGFGHPVISVSPVTLRIRQREERVEISSKIVHETAAPPLCGLQAKRSTSSKSLKLKMNVQHSLFREKEILSFVQRNTRYQVKFGTNQYVFVVNCCILFPLVRGTVARPNSVLK